MNILELSLILGYSTMSILFYIEIVNNLNISSIEYGKNPLKNVCNILKSEYILYIILSFTWIFPLPIWNKKIFSLIKYFKEGDEIDIYLGGIIFTLFFSLIWLIILFIIF